MPLLAILAWHYLGPEIEPVGYFSVGPAPSYYIHRLCRPPASAAGTRKCSLTSKVQLAANTSDIHITTCPPLVYVAAMKPPARLTTQALPRLFRSGRGSSVAIPSVASRAIHSSSSTPADVTPSFYAPGPPPEPPQPAVEHPYAKIERRRKQAELLKNAKELRDAASGKSTATKPLKKRFWKDAHVKEVNGTQSLAHRLFSRWKILNNEEEGEKDNDMHG